MGLVPRACRGDRVLRPLRGDRELRLDLLAGEDDLLPRLRSELGEELDEERERLLRLVNEKEGTNHKEVRWKGQTGGPVFPTDQLAMFGAPGLSGGRGRDCSFNNIKIIV